MVDATAAKQQSQDRDRLRRGSATGRPAWLLIVIEITVPIVLIALWWLASSSANNMFFPPLSAILERFGQLVLTPEYWENVSASLANIVLAFFLACLIGVVVGGILGLVDPLAWVFTPLIHFFRAIPPVALVPIFVSVMGFGNDTRILSICLAAVFPVLIATLDAVRGVEESYLLVARSYRIGTVRRFVLVTLPAAAPQIFSGIQMSFIVAFVVMIASEMLGSVDGLGAWTLTAQQSFAIVDMWAGVLTLGILGVGMSYCLTRMQRFVLQWYFASQQQEKTA